MEAPATAGRSDANRIAAKKRSKRGRPIPERRRFSGRSREGVRVRMLKASFVAQLGEIADDPIVKLQLNRAAELVMLSETLRAKAIRGEAVDLTALIRLEGAASRSVRMLFDLDRKREDDAASSLADYLAQMSGSVSVATSEGDTAANGGPEPKSARTVAARSRNATEHLFPARRKASGKASTSGDDEGGSTR